MPCSTTKKLKKIKENQPENPTGKTRAKKIWGVNTRKVQAKLLCSRKIK